MRYIDPFTSLALNSVSNNSVSNMRGFLFVQEIHIPFVQLAKRSIITPCVEKLSTIEVKCRFIAKSTKYNIKH